MTIFESTNNIIMKPSIKNILSVILLCMITGNADAQQTTGFIKAINGHFFINNKQYNFIGTNFWYGGMLGSKGEGGDRIRLLKELDLMKATGINNLRVLVGADGLDNIASKVQPALQPKAGVYNDSVFDGLDFLLSEMGKRNMYAVLYINNSWEWSGGFTQYLEWTGDYGKKILNSDGWDAYCKYVANFIHSAKAMQLFNNDVKHIITRTNRYTGKAYKNDPAIMSWQICNEPRPFSNDNKALMAEWLKKVAAYIKSLDHNHMVSTGSEGEMGCENDIHLWEDIHSSPNIDYYTIHIWPYNWSWIDKTNMEATIVSAEEKVFRYLDEHLAIAQKHNKPLVIEEFGIPRDGFSFSHNSTTKNRDYVFEKILDTMVINIKHKTVLAGCNFWAWSGTGRATNGHTFWQKGDQYLGDPAQEEQGLNSVFDTDNTMKIIKQYADKIGK